MPNTQTPTQSESTQSSAPIYVDREDGAEVIHGLISEAIKQNNMDDLRDIAEKLDELLRESRTALEQSNPALLERQQKSLAHARWHILARLKPAIIEDLFRHHFEFFFEYPPEDILLALRNVLLAEAEYAERDRIKQQLRDALAQSQVHIGEAKISVAGVLTNPTLANWFRDWRSFLGDRTPDSLMIVEYLNSSENIRVLKKEVREKISAVLKLTVALMKSSLTPEGLEDRVMVPDPFTGTFKTLDYGTLVDSGVEVPKDELKEVRAAYMLDENGKPLPLAERVKQLPEFEEIVKAAKQATTQTAMAISGSIPERKSTVTKPVLPVVPPKSTPAAPVTFPVIQRAMPGLPPILPTPVVPRQVATPKAAPVVQTMPRPVVFSAPVIPKTPTIPAAPVPVPTPVTPKPVQPKVAPMPKSHDDPHEMAERVLGEHKILFASVDLEKRFLSILTSYFSGARDKTETRETLLRVPQEGGVNLMAAKADEILVTAEEVLTGKSSLPKIVSRKKAAPAPVFKPRFEDVVKMAEKHKELEPKAPAEVEDILSTVNPIFESPQVMRPTTAFSPIASGNRPQKKMMQDITPFAPAAARVAPVMGPLDELRAFSLDEFHRVSPNPEEAAKHVYDKVQLLEAESIEKKAEGIKAWQQSPLNQLYIGIGNECLEKSVAVGDIIFQRTNDHKETLTQEEFTAVSDLNRKLRF